MNVHSILYTEINVLKAPSLHFSIIFNAFVQMTMFNEINARKIRNERNVFAGVHRNLVFSSIWIFCFIVQVKIKPKTNYNRPTFISSNLKDSNSQFRWYCFRGCASYLGSLGLVRFFRRRLINLATSKYINNKYTIIDPIR